MLQLNFKSGVPICDQIVNGIIRLRALGVMSAGESLPSVRNLAIELGVNPNTVQKAYQILEINGIIYSVKGKGSYIADDESAQNAIVNSAINDFNKAVSTAKELGISKDELIKVIKNVYGGQEND